MVRTKTLLPLLLTGGFILPTFADDAEHPEQAQRISPVESRSSIVVSQSDFKTYFTGGDVRIDLLYPKNDAGTHSGAYVTFEPGARTNWHTHPAGQHIIVTSGVGYTQTWKGEKRTIKAGDVVWCPVGVKHWHGASEKSAMTHLVITGVDEAGRNVTWLEPVTDRQYAGQ